MQLISFKISLSLSSSSSIAPSQAIFGLLHAAKATHGGISSLCCHGYMPYMAKKKSQNTLPRNIEGHYYLQTAW